MLDYKYKAKVVRVVDGDTVILDVDLGFFITHRIYTRLLEVNTPERGQENFALATEMLTSLLKEQTDDEGYIIISSRKTGKYGRWLIDIENVNSVLAERWPYG